MDDGLVSGDLSDGIGSIVHHCHENFSGSMYVGLLAVVSSSNTQDYNKIMWLY